MARMRKVLEVSAIACVLAIALSTMLPAVASQCPCNGYCVYEAPTVTTCVNSTIPDDCGCDSGVCKESFWFEPATGALTRRLIMSEPWGERPEGPCSVIGCDKGECFFFFNNLCYTYFECRSDLGAACDPENECHYYPVDFYIPGYWSLGEECCEDIV